MNQPRCDATSLKMHLVRTPIVFWSHRLYTHPTGDLLPVSLPSMRLLQAKNDDTFHISEFHAAIPPYAILSHTWGPNEEEVTFEDVLSGQRLHKRGYAKLRFCARQAAQDGLEYFWIDTCCINRSRSAELFDAIHCMFNYYKRAAICYVLLSDVVFGFDDGWKSFRESRWHTRAWTLQELLAPPLLHFFSAEHAYLGDRAFLSTQIHNATGIPMSALQGRAFSTFSVDTRLSWAWWRKATREEDVAYAIMG
jgi:hypothetical protein